MTNKMDRADKAVHDSPGQDSTSSDDDVPLVKLLTKCPSKKKRSRKDVHSSTAISNTNSEKDKSTDASDEEPRPKKKTPSRSQNSEEEENKSSTSNGTNRKNTDEITKVPSKDAKKPISAPQKSTDTHKKEAQDDESSDDEPLSEVAKKMKSRHQRAPSKDSNPVMKSKRNAAHKRVDQAETSSESSEYTPLAKKRKAKPAKKRKYADKKKTQVRDNSSNDDDDDDDDDVPLVILLQEQRKTKKGTTKATKKTTVSRDLSCTALKDGSLLEAANHPQVTKMLKIILHRCDFKEAGQNRNRNTD
ncbi:uncharacterized protein ACBR49_017624 isoform 2-T2 [Aulostomus maculatus]